VPSVLGGRKGIRPVKTERWGAGVVICLERGADLRRPYGPADSTATQSLAPVKSRLVPDKGPLSGCVGAMCVYRLFIVAL